MVDNSSPTIAKSKQGSFTEWAKDHGFETVQAAQDAVLASPNKYDPAIVKKANFRRNFAGNQKRPPTMLESLAHNT